MESSSTSHSVQPSAVHASHTSGGWRGSTPTPSTRLSSWSTATLRGTAALSPNSRVSPGRGDSPKTPTSRPPNTSCPQSCGVPPASWRSTASSSQGTTVRSASVAKATASSVSVRLVATSVPAGSTTASGCGAESQNVTSARAAEGGKRVTPSRSRKARWFFSGTRLRR